MDPFNDEFLTILAQAAEKQRKIDAAQRREQQLTQGESKEITREDLENLSHLLFGYIE